MLHSGIGTVIVWSYNREDAEEYVKDNPNHNFEIIEQKGNWETQSESWITVSTVKFRKES